MGIYGFSPVFAASKRILCFVRFVKDDYTFGTKPGYGEPRLTGQAVIDLQDPERNPDYRVVY